MAVMDEFREEREQIKTAPLKVKWQYFKDYYLMWTLGGLALAAVVIAFAVSVLSQKKDALYAVFVNYAPAETAEENVVQAFSGQYLKNPRREQIVVDTSVRLQYLDLEEETAAADAGQEDAQSAEDIAISGIKYTYEDEEKLVVLAMSGTLDLLVAGQDLFERYALAEWFMDLRDVLDADTFEAYEKAGRILYCGDIPTGIRMDGAALLNENYVYTENDGALPYAGFVNGCAHADTAAAFLAFLE